MAGFNDLPPEERDALMIWAEIMFGNHSVRPIVDPAHLTEKPAHEVLAGEVHDIDISIWLHDAFTEMVREGSRYEFELDPTKEEIPNRPAQEESPAPGVKPRQCGKYLRETMHRLKMNEPATYVDHSLQIHFTRDVKTEISEIRNRLHETEDMYDAEDQSNLRKFDEVFFFTLTRTKKNRDPDYPAAWRVRRFKPSDLFGRLESVDQDEIKVVTLIDPLQ